MTKRKEHIRHSAKVTRGPRWKALRMQALERDNWQCQHCGSRKRLECHHVKPVRTHPELAYTLSNLLMLCGKCHSAVTRIEVGHKPLTPKRQAWRDLLRDTQRNPFEQNGDSRVGL
ncbi:MAG: HNH endonuclease [Pseudomonadota bacterium]|jgi:5-methylcytosine-specific restriction endonuclease McrA|nr:HNH endonuclease [Pseudomonadota bacterium]MEE3072518.1 HNH endonuclease [Pseudomonadota bacterium]